MRRNPSITITRSIAIRAILERPNGQVDSLTRTLTGPGVGVSTNGRNASQVACANDFS